MNARLVCFKCISSKCVNKKVNYELFFIYEMMVALINLQKFVNMKGTEDSSLLGCKALSLGQWLPKFRRQHNPPKCRERFTFRPFHILKGLNPEQYRRENLKSRIKSTTIFERLVFSFEKLII
jgi:hypothetical protein